MVEKEVMAMQYILKLIISDLTPNSFYKKLNICGASMMISEREIYKNFQIYNEYTLNLVFSVNTGTWFDKIIRFDIIMTTENCILKVRRGYGDTYLYYKYKDYKSIVDFIIQEITNLQNENRTFINKNKLRGCV